MNVFPWRERTARLSIIIDHYYSVLWHLARVGTGLILLFHAFQHVGEVSLFVENARSMGFPYPSALGPIPIVVEFICAAALITGLGYRPTSVMLLLLMSFDVIVIHFGDGFRDVQFMLAMACLAFVFALGNPADRGMRVKSG